MFTSSSMRRMAVALQSALGPCASAHAFRTVAESGATGYKGCGRLGRSIGWSVPSLPASIRANRLGHVGNPSAWRLESLPDKKGEDRQLPVLRSADRPRSPHRRHQFRQQQSLSSTTGPASPKSTGGCRPTPAVRVTVQNPPKADRHLRHVSRAMDARSKSAPHVDF